MKQVIFNVGGGLSTYTEFNGKRLITDIGKSDSINPINDFLIPLYKKRKETTQNGKYKIEQIIISHPHNDHISAIKDFDENFYPDLLTCPNDNEGMNNDEKINWKLVDNNDNVKILRNMLKGRVPPLKTTDENDEFIYYLPPKYCENDKDLMIESYCNNISIALFIIINGHRVFLPGDLQKDGIKRLIEKDRYLSGKLNGGVDVLIAAHHGLRSSFSDFMFKKIKDQKTRCMNIISEKQNTDDNREVDTRYSSSDYCKGHNNLSTSSNPKHQIKTSNGNVYIDYSNKAQPRFEIISDIDELLKKF